jgi:hypothetical protein
VAVEVPYAADAEARGGEGRGAWEGVAGAGAGAGPPFTATVRSRFVTQSLQAVTVTSPTHGAPDASSLRTSSDGIEVSFRDLFKPRAGTKAATNLQMRWVADGIVPNMACVGRQLAGAGQLASATAGTDTLISQDAAATALELIVLVATSDAADLEAAWVIARKSFPQQHVMLLLAQGDD